MPVETLCAGCGKKLQRSPSQAKRYPVSYCRDCIEKYRANQGRPGTRRTDVRK